MKFKDNNGVWLEGELVKTFTFNGNEVFLVFDTEVHRYGHGTTRYIVPSWRVLDNLKNKQLEDYL